MGENNVENNGDTTVIVPLVQADSIYVGGFIKAGLGDTVSLDLYRNRDYQALPYAGSSSVAQSNVTTAENFALRMMLMDNLVFGYTKFEIRDKKLFAGNSNADTNNMQRVVEFGNSNNNFNGGGTISNNYIYSVCVTVTTTTYTTSRHCETFEYCTAQVGPGLCDNCGTYCYLISTPHTSSSTDCEYWEDGGSGMGSWPDFPSGGTGGGTSGGGTSPCSPVPAIIESVVPVNCPLIPNPWPVSIRDANGYYYSRIAELKAYLALDPFAIDPCDSLNLMPLATYGHMYQEVARFTPPVIAVNRLDSIRNAQGGWIVDNFNFQSLTDAYGTVVNCDFFPLKITQFPIDNATGLHMTPAQLVEYFRLNINSFITPPVGVNFSCVFGPQFDDCVKWNQTSGNAIGALNHIYIPGPGAGPIGTSNSGSVMLSDYKHVNNPNNEEHYFKLTTLETPFDYEHPVAGNREFGIYNTPNNLGQYTFYTMGVDRIWDWVTEFSMPNNYGFNKADELWTNVQQNMKTFINNNGGVAVNYPTPKIVARPRWNDVKEFLLMHIDFAELKRRLGC